MSEQNFVPKANNNGQTLGTSARQWTAAYVSSVPDEDSAVVNKAYLDSSRASRAIFEIFPTFRKDDAPINGAYDCDGSEYSKSDFKGENNPYDMLVLGKAETCTYDEYNTQIANHGMCSKFALDTTNQKFKVPTVYGIITDAKGISSLAAPSTTSIQIPVVAGTNYPYTAPSNGWLVVKSTSISLDWHGVYLNQVSNNGYVVSRGPLNGTIGGIMPVSEGETVDLYAESGNAQAFFIYTIGAIESLLETRYIKTRYLVQLATEGQEVSIQQYEDALYEYAQTLQQQLVYNRFVGEVFSSLVPINDNGVKLLDGSVLEVGGIYDEFINHIVGFKESYPNLFCTEEEWNTSISTYGVCGKFVYTEGVSLRIPKITGFVEGTLDATELGNLIEAGLPNITGDSNIGGNAPKDVPSSGALKQVRYQLNSVVNATPSDIIDLAQITLDASLSNPIYGNSDTVQPQSIRVYYYIVVANGIKQDVEIDLDNVLTEVNKRQRIMQKVKVTGTTPSIDVQSGKAYSCGTVSSLTINSLPGRDNFEESCILFTGTSSTSITVNSTDLSYVGDMSISSDGDYIISIMNNTLILNKVISGN